MSWIFFHSLPAHQSILLFPFVCVCVCQAKQGKASRPYFRSRRDGVPHNGQWLQGQSTPETCDSPDTRHDSLTAALATSTRAPGHERPPTGFKPRRSHEAPFSGGRHQLETYWFRTVAPFSWVLTRDTWPPVSKTRVRDMVALVPRPVLCAIDSPSPWGGGDLITASAL